MGTLLRGACCCFLVTGCAVLDGDDRDPNACRESLSAIHALEFTPGPSTMGVPNPVTVDVPIGGLDFRSGGDGVLRESLLMDCTLAVALAESAPVLLARDVTEVVDFGVYDYRCIGEGTPPDCPEGLSQHASATAIDIAGFNLGSAAEYTFLDDWVIDTSGAMTCTPGWTGEANTFLHESVCELKATGLWNIVLTPNFNDVHRDHAHLDLTPGADFID